MTTATTVREKMFFRTVAVLVAISVDACRGSDPPKPYGSAPPAGNGYHSGYEPEFQRPLAVFTEKPVNVAGFVLIPVIQVPSSDLRMIYRPQIDSVSKTEPIVMCKSSTKSVEATPAVQVPLQQPFYLYDERTLIPFPKAVTILHGGYRVSIPVGLVVAPVPANAFRDGPVFVTTLFAVPAGPLPAPSPISVRLVPWTPYSPSPAPYLMGPPPPPPPPQYPVPPVTHSPPPYSQEHPVAHPPSSQYPQSHPPAHPSSQYSHGHPAHSPPSPPPPPPQYSPEYTVHPPSQPPPPPPQYSQPPYSQPVPAAPAYYQHQPDYSEDNGNDLRYRDPPGKLYSHYTASSPFHNSKESPVLHQLREESEKNRKKYGPLPPYSHQYQPIETA